MPVSLFCVVSITVFIFSRIVFKYAIVNLAVIFPIYKVVNGLVKYDYSDDRIENISKQYLE